MSPPGAFTRSQPTIRVVEKQARANERKRRVRVISDCGKVIGLCEPGSPQYHRFIAAPNAEVLRTHAGVVTAIRLLSFDDQQGHSGEHHGSSLTTTRKSGNETEHKWIGQHHPWADRDRRIEPDPGAPPLAICPHHAPGVSGEVVCQATRECGLRHAVSASCN